MNTPDAQLVHRSHGRIRLRIPSKRRDLGYFVKLYDQIRRLPGIKDVVINPKTTSVLLIYDEGHHDELSTALGTTTLFLLDPANQPPGTPLLSHPSNADTTASPQATVNDMRAILFLIMFGLSVHQLLRGQILAPALTVILYAVDLGAGFIKEKQAGDAPQCEPGD